MAKKDILEDLYIFEMANSHQGSVEHGIDIIHEMGKIARKHNVKAEVKLPDGTNSLFFTFNGNGNPDFAGFELTEE